MTPPDEKRRKQPVIKLGDLVVPISRLHLDSQNPRHDPLEGDTEIISQLCNAELVAELAQDIARRGALSPLEVMGVIPFDGHPGHYITVEGNRRTCALILLADPSRAPSPDLRSQLRRVAASSKAPTRIKVHAFKKREDAKQWIDLRHLGPQGGVGAREWNAQQKTRAAGENTQTTSRANTLALEVLDRLQETGRLTPAQRAKARLTTITRYLGTPGVRAILGLGSANKLIYTHSPDEVLSALYRLVLDSIEPQADGNYIVNSRTGSAERLAYANTLKSNGLTPITHIGTSGDSDVETATAKNSGDEQDTPVDQAEVPDDKSGDADHVDEGAEDAGTTQDTSPDDGQGRKKSATDPSKLPTLFDSSFLIETRDPVLLHLRREALSLPLKDFSFSGNYLLRAIVEQVMVLFAKRRSKFYVEISDQKLTTLCANELRTLGVTGKALTVLEKAGGNQATPYSLHSLGNAIHGGSIPTKKDLRAYADTWMPSIRAMLDALN